MSFASYFALDGIADLEKYYRKRAAEELLHHQWIMDYLSAGDFVFKYPAIELNTENPASQLDPFRMTVDREIQTTQMIYAIYDAACAEKDYMTVSWLLEKLIKEQVEEENTSRTAKAIMEEDTNNIFDKAEAVYDLLGD